MKKTIFWALLCGFTATGATQAEPVDGRTAQAALFQPRGVDVRFVNTEGLSAQDQALLPALETQMEKSDQVFYYGATAIAPDEGFLSQTNQIAGNHHSVEAAEAAALAACNAARNGGAACIVVAQILPRNWEAGRAVQLGQGATRDFRRSYRRGRGEKALAVSASTGQWGIARGEGAAEAALAACADQQGAGSATDCNIIVAD